jgi:small subunit ribosomal protein S9
MNDYDVSRFTNMTEAERLPKFGYYYGFGKRKKARASAYLKPGTGKVTINGKPAHQYLQNTIYRGKLYAPLVMTGNTANLDVRIIVFGGGISGQMEAIIPAISKALVQINPEYIEKLAKCKI